MAGRTIKDLLIGLGVMLIHEMKSNCTEPCCHCIYSRIWL